MAAALEDKMTLTFRNEMKNMMKALVPTPVPIKAVEERSAAVGGFVQGNSGYPPYSVASYTRPPGFTQPNPLASRPNQGYNRNGNNGNQVNHGANSGLTQQAQAYQAPSTQVPVTYARFEAY
ncbi:hypothetical protein Tco_0900748, partial [Tanacetum coccineum]